MAGLKIFGGPNGEAPAKKSTYADDVVGRFRSGYVANKRPVALQEWRVTTGDPEVAEKIAEILDGDEPQRWDAAGEDDLEVFTQAKELEVILDGPRALRQKMVLWGRNKAIYMSDGAEIFYPEDRKGEPDPDADLSLQERKAKAREGTGAEPQVEIYFRIAGVEDLGLFKFQSGSWSLVGDLGYNGTADELEEIDGPTRATLSLEEVSFVAKNGPRAGQTVSYTKPVLALNGAA